MSVQGSEDNYDENEDNYDYHNDYDSNKSQD